MARNKDIDDANDDLKVKISVDHKDTTKIINPTSVVLSNKGDVVQKNMIK